MPDMDRGLRLVKKAVKQCTFLPLAMSTNQMQHQHGFVLLAVLQCADRSSTFGQKKRQTEYGHRYLSSGSFPTRLNIRLERDADRVRASVFSGWFPRQWIGPKLAGVCIELRRSSNVTTGCICVHFPISFRDAHNASSRADNRQ